MGADAAGGQSSATYKAIFLDVDGVLHPANESQRPCRKPCMDVLKEIIAQSNANIVLSSNWRLDEWGIGQVNSHLERAGLEPVAGHTHPQEDFYNTRADEILEYLHSHPEVTHFVVLDDVELNFEDPDTPVPACVAAHSVQTDERHGLQPKDSQAALARLEIPIDRASLEHAQRYGMERPPLAAGVAATPTQAEAMQPPPPLPPVGKQISRKPSISLLTSLVENELTLQGLDMQEAPRLGLRRVASCQCSLGEVGLSRRSSRGDLEGMIRD
jgi:hypothetical protein